MEFRIENHRLINVGNIRVGKNHWYRSSRWWKKVQLKVGDTLKTYLINRHSAKKRGIELGYLTSNEQLADRADLLLSGLKHTLKKRGPIQPSNGGWAYSEKILRLGISKEEIDKRIRTWGEVPKGSVITDNGYVEIAQQHIAEGSFKKVHLASVHSPEGMRRMALLWPKPRNPSMQARIDANKEMEREHEKLAGLKHDNLVSLEKFAFASGQGSRVVTLLDTLKTSADKFAQDASPKQKLAYAKDIAKGLTYLHKRGLVHRDVKLGNTAKGKKGGVLIDVGGLTQEGLAEAFYGTPWFWAPEVFKMKMSNLEFTKANDLWALGLTYYQLLYGDLPKTLKAWFHPSRGYNDYLTQKNIKRYLFDRNPQSKEEAIMQHAIRNLVRINPKERKIDFNLPS